MEHWYLQILTRSAAATRSENTQVKSSITQTWESPNLWKQYLWILDFINLDCLVPVFQSFTGKFLYSDSYVDWWKNNKTHIRKGSLESWLYHQRAHTSSKSFNLRDLKLFICRTKRSTFLPRSLLGHDSRTLWDSSTPPHRLNSLRTGWFHTLSALVSGSQSAAILHVFNSPPNNLLPGLQQQKQCEHFTLILVASGSVQSSKRMQ